MPRRFKTRRRRFRKKRKNYSLNRSGATSAGKLRGPLPLKLKTTLRYTEQFTTNPGAGLAGVYVFSANSVYDPNVTAGGHQARGFDNIMPLYNHFVVIGSKITTQFVNNSNVDLICGITPLDNSTTEADPNNYMENQRSVWTVVTAGSETTKKLSLQLAPHKFLGRGSPMADKDLRGAVTSNPAEQVYYHVWVASSDGFSDPATVHAISTIDYLTMFGEPNQPIQS